MKKRVISQLCPLDGVKLSQEKCIIPKIMVKEDIHFPGNTKIYRQRTGELKLFCESVNISLNHAGKAQALGILL